jgi:nucleoside-diphosphate-sugar epimerase
MRIFLAGATGAIGKPLLPMLISAGHTVVATTQHNDKMMSIHSAGATPMLVKALNKEEVLSAVQEARPEIVIHQLTAIPANLNLRHFDEGFAVTTGSVLKVQTTCWPRRERLVPEGLSHRAMPGGMQGRATGSKLKTIH